MKFLILLFIYDAVAVFPSFAENNSQILPLEIDFHYTVSVIATDVVIKLFLEGVFSAVGGHAGHEEASQGLCVGIRGDPGRGL